MKCAIISSKALAAAGRWDVAYFLGDSEADARIQRAEKRLQEAQEAVNRAKAHKAQEDARVQQFVESGDVKIITPNKPTSGF
jgi:hypothetical protein